MIRLAQSTFPYRCHAPSLFQKHRAKFAIPRNIRFELGLPKLHPGRWTSCITTIIVAMPETAMHKDHGVMLRKNEVRVPKNLPRMKAEAKAV